MKPILLAALAAFVAGAMPASVRATGAGDARGSDLDRELAAMDARLFHAAFVSCDMAQVRALLADDIEFVHDLTGMRRGADVLADFERLTGNCPARQGVRRVLVDGTLRAFPIAGFGAVQSGEHRFLEAGADSHTAARFVTLWRRDADGWRVARVLSYDHVPVPGAPGTR